MRILKACLMLAAFSPCVYAGDWSRISGSVIEFSGVIDKDSYAQYFNVS